ncbi:hypothetical protein A7982_13601 [Minicystis rosea]|nr:hypothetical protein A7982_13601 [Minicystis rosea]
MTPAEVLALITLHDHLFQLGGRLVAAAQEKRPELNLTPLPTLDEMDAARSDAAADGIIQGHPDAVYHDVGVNPFMGKR